MKVHREASHNEETEEIEVIVDEVVEVEDNELDISVVVVETPVEAEDIADEAFT